MSMEGVKQGVLLQGLLFEVHIETVKGNFIALTKMGGERGQERQFPELGSGRRGGSIDEGDEVSISGTHNAHDLLRTAFHENRCTVRSIMVYSHPNFCLW